MGRQGRELLLAAWMLAIAAPTHAQQTAVITGQVTTRQDGLSLPGATVAIAALKLSATTDEEGRYRLTVPARESDGRSVELRVTFKGLRPATTTIELAPGTITQDFALAVAFTEAITVGSRAPGAEAEKAVPVDILTADQIERTTERIRFDKLPLDVLTATNPCE